MYSEGFLDTNGGVSAVSKLFHELLTLALGAEPLLNADYDELKLLSVLHEVFSPSLTLYVCQYLLLYHRAGVFAALSLLSGNFTADGSLQSCGLVLAEPVYRGFEDVARLILHEQLGNTTLPALVFANTEKLGLFWICADLICLPEDSFSNCTVSFVDSGAKDGPELVSKVSILDTITEADLTDPDGLEDTAGSQLVLNLVIVEGLRVA